MLCESRGGTAVQTPMGGHLVLRTKNNFTRCAVCVSPSHILRRAVYTPFGRSVCIRERTGGGSTPEFLLSTFLPRLYWSFYREKGSRPLSLVHICQVEYGKLTNESLSTVPLLRQGLVREETSYTINGLGVH